MVYCVYFYNTLNWDFLFLQTSSSFSTDVIVSIGRQISPQNPNNTDVEESIERIEEDDPKLNLHLEHNDARNRSLNHLQRTVDTSE